MKAHAKTPSADRRSPGPLKKSQPAPDRYHQDNTGSLPSVRHWTLNGELAAQYPGTAFDRWGYHAGRHPRAVVGDGEPYFALLGLDHRIKAAGVGVPANIDETLLVKEKQVGTA